MTKPTELIVMLKQDATEADVASVLEKLKSESETETIAELQIVEITRMLDDRIFALLSITSGDSTYIDSIINQLLNDKRVEIAQINSTYTHC